MAFEREISNGDRRVETALALVLGDVTEDAPLLRIHSQCFTGEMLGSLRCDCGLMAKLQAYSLQDIGFDTVDANHVLGFPADYRDFTLSVAILHELGVGRVRLLSNNPQKASALNNAGIEVIAQVPCEVAPTPHSIDYLRTKKERMGHKLALEVHEGWGRPRPQTLGSAVSTGDEAVPAPEEFEFASIDEALDELKAGRMIVVIDDEDRENEGDLTMAAEAITPEAINFMATHGRGLICLAMTGELRKILPWAGQRSRSRLMSKVRA